MGVLFRETRPLRTFEIGFLTSVQIAIRFSRFARHFCRYRFPQPISTFGEHPSASHIAKSLSAPGVMAPSSYLWTVVTSVSYTHLDVYKRQRLKRSCAWSMSMASSWMDAFESTLTRGGRQ